MAYVIINTNDTNDNINVEYVTAHGRAIAVITDDQADELGIDYDAVTVRAVWESDDDITETDEVETVYAEDDADDEDIIAYVMRDMASLVYVDGNAICRRVVERD